MRPFILAVVFGLAVSLSAEDQEGAAKPATVHEKSPGVLHVVLLEIGPSYVQSRPPQEQVGFAEHAARMRALAKEGTVILGGPLLRSFATPEPTGALLVVRASTLDEARALAEGDALVKSGALRIGDVRAFIVGVSSPVPSE